MSSAVDTLIQQPSLLNTFLEGVGIEPETIDKGQILGPLFDDMRHKI